MTSLCAIQSKGTLYLVHAHGIDAMLVANDLQMPQDTYMDLLAIVWPPFSQQDSKMAHLPELSPDLVAALASLDVHNLSHGCDSNP